MTEFFIIQDEEKVFAYYFTTFERAMTFVKEELKCTRFYGDEEKMQCHDDRFRNIWWITKKTFEA
jgi:hypothetical protein